MQDGATVREWTDILRRVRFDSLPSARRRRLKGATIRQVGQAMALYADFATGGRCRPGLVRLAVEQELAYDTVKDAVGLLRQLGLLRLVRASGRPAKANEYQLCIPTDLADRDDLDVWDPDQMEGVVRELADRKKGRWRGPDASHKRDLRGAIDPAGAQPAGSHAPRRSVDNPHLRGEQLAAGVPRRDGPAGGITPSSQAPAGGITPDLRGAQHPAIYQRPKHNTDPPADDQDVRTAVTGPRARTAVLDPDPPPKFPEPVRRPPAVLGTARPGWERSAQTYLLDGWVRAAPPGVAAERSRRGRALVDAAIAAHARGEPLDLPDPPDLPVHVSDRQYAANVVPLRRPA